MANLSQNDLERLASDIEIELGNLKQVEQDILKVNNLLANESSYAEFFYESLALKLHSFYTGCERIFQMITNDLNGEGHAAGNFSWHKRLLQRMGKPNKERPAVLSAETIQELSEYLSFRHVVRNIYGFEIDPDRIDKLVARYPTVWQLLQCDLTQFVDWLRTLAHSLSPE